MTEMLASLLLFRKVGEYGSRGATKRREKARPQDSGCVRRRNATTGRPEMLAECLDMGDCCRPTTDVRSASEGKPGLAFRLVPPLSHSFPAIRSRARARRGFSPSFSPKITRSSMVLDAFRYDLNMTATCTREGLARRRQTELVESNRGRVIVIKRPYTSAQSAGRSRSCARLQPKSGKYLRVLQRRIAPPDSLGSLSPSSSANVTPSARSSSSFAPGLQTSFLGTRVNSGRTNDSERASRYTVISRKSASRWVEERHPDSSSVTQPELHSVLSASLAAPNKPYRRAHAGLGPTDPRSHGSRLALGRVESCAVTARVETRNLLPLNGQAIPRPVYVVLGRSSLYRVSIMRRSTTA
ncbi:hypothetical protein GY45DRAFT_68705 [Cubamyces sp. BRFM 1775]|nr:hypothetical protein GY45DRAFT_68705 [Cubamyces sp. BRFM 1775]